MKEHWIYRNSEELKVFMRVVFGFVWFIDGALKFQPNMVSVFPQLVQAAGQGQPVWLMPWFNFWAGVVSQNPAIWVYLIGGGELLLGIALISGSMRKITYIAGISLSLIIWAVPEGFGGPYGPSSTDIGTGVIYAFVFLALILINAKYGPSRYSLDYYIEKRIKWWKKLAEFNPT